jgi:hypothetical protein
VAELIGADTDSERALSQKMGKRSHAERQKRYRERLKAKRDGAGVTPVSP